jgi:hypothetical protein
VPIDAPFDETPHGRTFLRLFDLGRGDSPYFADAWEFALVWMLAGHLEATGRLPTDLAFDDLRTLDGWRKLADAGLIPPEVAGLAFGTGHRWTRLLSAGESRPADEMEAAWRILSDELRTGIPEPWDLADSYWHATGAGVGGASGGLAPSLADTLVALLGPVAGRNVWCPFDYFGQLAVRLARAGATVFTASPSGVSRTELRLLQALDGRGNDWNLRVDEAAILDQSAVDIELAVCAPPSSGRAGAWEAWARFAEGTGHERAARSWLRGAMLALKADRPETATVWAVWSRIRDRAVIVVPPSLLHARGQEQHLRERLIAEQCVDAVISLPGRLMSGSTLPGATLVLDRRARPRKVVRMVEVTGSRLAGKDRRGDSMITDPQSLTALARREEEESNAIDVRYGDIPRYDSNLTPGRYLLRSLKEPLTGELLGDLVEILRPPPKATGRDMAPALEVGIPGLDAWGYVSRPAKALEARASKLRGCQLQPGDLVLAIKGSVGKVGLVGDDAPAAESRGTDALPWVVSQSCVGLRLRPGARITPVFLYMFLRSGHGREMIDALRVGAVIPHVTPGTLLEELRIPQPTEIDLREAEQTFAELRRVEAEIAEMLVRRDRLAKKLWPSELDQRDQLVALRQASRK